LVIVIEAGRKACARDRVATATQLPHTSIGGTALIARPHQRPCFAREPETIASTWEPRSVGHRKGGDDAA
jgi:hypothetical protein